MKILAVDTSSSVAAVAVMDGEKLAAEYIIDHKKNHSQKLMPMIDEVLGSLGLKPGDMDIFAVGTGPGSFTGLRIGVTTIKAMAYPVNKPVAGIPVLDALAFNLVYSGQIICPIMDARNNQVYTALYRQAGGMQERISDYMGLPVNELVKMLKDKILTDKIIIDKMPKDEMHTDEMPKDEMHTDEMQSVIFLGDAVKIHRDYLRQELGEKCLFAPAGLMSQKASSIAQLAMMKAAAGQLESSFELVPFYLRKSQAEREFDKKNTGETA